MSDSPSGSALEQLGINVIRGLAMDAPRKANSGHTGTAMALAPLAHVLWTRVMRHDPDDPKWPDRDRFVLSCGHASILLYSLLYLTGYGLTLDDLGAVPAVGQQDPGASRDPPDRPGSRSPPDRSARGWPTGSGMGLAERWLRARFGPELVDHHTFVLCSDGDLEEGISHEAASLAGHLGLGRLIYVYDDNHITIDGPTELAYSDDVAERFAAYGWHTEDIGEVANDTDALEAAVRRAMAVEDKPSMISLRSHIGWPAPAHDGHRRRPRDTAQRRGDPQDQGDPRPPAGPDVLGPRRGPRLLPGFDGPGTRAAPGVAGTVRRLGRGPAGMGRRSGRARPWPGGNRSSRRSRPATRLATRRAINACINATAELIPGLMAGSADLTEQHRGGPDGGVAQERRAPRRDPDPLRDPRARHGRGDDRAWPCTAGSSRWAGPSSSSATTCGPPSAWPRCAERTSSTRGPTTRSGSVRTARPTNRSSSWPPCGPCPACG